MMATFITSYPQLYRPCLLQFSHRMDGYGYFFGPFVLDRIRPSVLDRDSASELASLRSPRDLDGYRYVYARVYWTRYAVCVGQGLPPS